MNKLLLHFYSEQKMEKYLFITIFSLAALLSYSQAIPKAEQGKYHALRWEELSQKANQRSLNITAPPENPRSIAEFEPNQGVIIAGVAGYFNDVDFGVPYSLLAELSENDTIYLICKANLQSNLRSTLQANGVNINHLKFVTSDIDSYWCRDYSPWFVEYGDRQIGLIDYLYNRPRPNDDEITNVFGEYFNKEVFGMQVVHTGGNYMTDGLGVAASCSASLDVENADEYGHSQADLDTIFKNYLGITNYMHLDDPLADYIAHIDCWGKFLDVDKVLITKVPASHQHYADFEAMADFWANSYSSYGNKYQVFRTFSPNGEPYSNSLILNNKVYLAFPNNDATNNANAKAVYEEAMPGYEVIGFLPNNNQWLSTDALHCRTHEVPRFDMLRIAHIPILDTVELADNYNITANIYTLGNGGEIASAKVFYSLNGNDFLEAEMQNSGNDIYNFSFQNLHIGDSVAYYIQGTSENGQVQTHPFIGVADPHVFVVANSLPTRAEVADLGYIKCYPNPASEVLYFISNAVDNGDYKVEIINNQGKIVKTVDTQAHSTWEQGLIDISDLAAGLYFVRMYNDRKAYSCKFSKL